MNEKLKRVLSIVGLCAMGVFSVAFVMFLYKPSLFGGRIGYVAAALFLIGGGIFLWIYLAKGFPAQQRKIEEMDKIKQEYEKKKEQEAAAAVADSAVENSENSEISGESCTTTTFVDGENEPKA